MHAKMRFVHPASSRVLRRWFFVSVGLATVVLFLLRFLVFPEHSGMADWEQTTSSVLDNLIAAALTSLALGIAYVLFSPADTPPAVDIIHSRDIPDLIHDSARTCDRWEVRARTASYFVRVTLPLLVENALRRGGQISIKVLVIDPRDDNVMRAYATFRSNHANAGWTPERAKTEILSTILACAIYQNEAPRLDIEVALSPAFWLLSLDITEDVILVTGQNKGDPCLCIRRGSDMYSIWRDEFMATYGGSHIVRPKIDGVTIHDLKRPNTDTSDRVRSLFKSLGLDVNDQNINDSIHYGERKHNYE
jgi:hypothetical protein